MTLRLDRRHFLTGAGLSLALPLLESQAATDSSASAKRFVAVGTYLGFHQPTFFPAEIGANYSLPELLGSLKSHRSRMTILSGLDHRGRNGHEGWQAWITGSALGSLSLDQKIAGHVGHHTRYASLQLTCGTPPRAARLSFTEAGVPLPMVGRPSVLYQTLFRSAADQARIGQLLTTNKSALDGLIDEVGSLEQRLSAKDRHKLGEYLAAVRDVERRIQKQQMWLDKPTPKVHYPLPTFDPVAPDLALECETLMYDLMALALTTDSTRVVTFLVPGWSQVFTIDGRRLSAGYHGLSHHGNDPQKISEYNLVGQEHVRRFANFLGKLRDHEDAQGRPLLESTVALLGSGMGNANTHDNSNLPTLIAGGPLRHGQHHRIARTGAQPRKLGDLFLTLLQSFGIHEQQFAGAGQNLNELLL